MGAGATFPDVALPVAIGRRMRLGPFPSARDALRFLAYATAGAVVIPFFGAIAWRVSPTDSNVRPALSLTSSLSGRWSPLMTPPSTASMPFPGPRLAKMRACAPSAIRIHVVVGFIIGVLP